MKIEKSEIQTAKNLIVAIRKATYNDFKGDEMLALAVCYQWITAAIKEAETPVQIEPVIAPVTKGKAK